MQPESRLHCFVGFGNDFNTLKESSPSRLLPVLIFLAISSAHFSALCLVLRNTKACFPILMVSRATFTVSLPVNSGIGMGSILKKMGPRRFELRTLRCLTSYQFRISKEIVRSSQAKLRARNAQEQAVVLNSFLKITNHHA